MSTNGYVSAEDLLAYPAVREEDMETLRGAKIRVRGLTRTQVLHLRTLSDAKTFEPQMLAYGVAEPKLTKTQAQAWEDSAPAGEIEDITDKIYSLSGMSDDAGKAAYKSVRSKSGA